MFKLLAGAALGFAAAWFMDSKEGANRRALAKEKATGFAGKGREQAQSAVQSAQQAAEQVKEKASSGTGNGGGLPGDESYEPATAAEPATEPETFRQSS